MKHIPHLEFCKPACSEDLLAECIMIHSLSAEKAVAARIITENGVGHCTGDGITYRIIFLIFWYTVHRGF